MKKSNLRGKRYGKLIVIEDNEGTLKCKCDCGNVIELPRNLIYHRKNGCGCAAGVKEFGFRVKRFSSDKPNKNNKLGIKGVCQDKAGKYLAYIYVDKKPKILGKFDNVNDAIDARKEAEEVLFLPSIQAYNQKYLPAV